MAFGQDAGFADQNDGGDDAGAGWADGFGDEAADDSSKYPLNFARVELKEVVNASTPGNKQKKAGLQVNAAVNWNSEANQLQMEFEFSNQSGGAIADFDLMINKNSFGVCPDAPCSKHGIKYPEPFETSEVQYLPLKIDKKNADVKSPPKHPFALQIALKSSLDIFYFTVPC